MFYFLTLLLIVSSNGLLVPNERVNIPEDAIMDFNEIAQKYVQKGEEYELISQGYILKLFRIPGDINKPILFIHGALDSSDSFIMRGNSSLAITLSRSNYDVWAVNLRGNRYSRNHVNMNPNSNKKFWDYSLHEYGFYDLPATIDFILNKTGQQRLSAIGYSEGTTSMYVLGSTRPEYNDKIKVFISLAPVCYLHNTRPFMSYLIDAGPLLNEGFLAIGAEEIAGFKSPSRALINSICLQKNAGYDICMQNGLFLVTGADANEIEPEFLPIILGHFPAGTSRKNLIHYIQIRNRRIFANYDYGAAKNMIEYNTTSPPEYDLSKVTMNVALIVAKNDLISTIKDVELLRKQLPNVVAYRVMKNDAFNHIDYVWGRSTHKTMFPHIFNILNKYQ